MKIFEIAVNDLAGLATFSSIIFGGFAMLIRYFRKSISDPIKTQLKQLNRELEEMNNSRRKNEKRLFDITDDHTKELIKLNGRMNTFEVMNQSNTMRIDRAEKEIKGE